MSKMLHQIEALSIAIQSNRPVLLIGPPGIGKTTIIGGICAQLDMLFETVLALLRDPTDFGGLPMNKEGADYYELKVAGWAHRLSESEIGDRRGCVFFDEANQATQAVQAALMRPVLEGVVGDVRLGRNVARVAAMNPPEMAANGHVIAAPLSNRFTQVPFEADAEFWCEQAIGGFEVPKVQKLPENWRELIPLKIALITGYISNRPAMMIQVPDTEEEQAKPWPSPRSWIALAELLAACESIRASQTVVNMLAAGTIGEAAAIEFLTWSREMDLPNPEDLLKNPEKLVLPDRNDRRFAVLNSVTAAVLNGKNTPKRWESAVHVMAKASELGATDIAAVSMRQLAKKKPSGVSSFKPEHIDKFIPMMKRAGLI